MSDVADIYRKEILLAAMGRNWSLERVADPAALERIVNILVDYERANGILRSNGHGNAGMTLSEVAQAVPVNARGKLKLLFGGE